MLSIFVFILKLTIWLDVDCCIDYLLYYLDCYFAVCNFVVHDRCSKNVLSPCSTVALSYVKVWWRWFKLIQSLTISYSTLFSYNLVPSSHIVHPPLTVVLRHKIIYTYYCCISNTYYINQVYTYANCYTGVKGYKKQTLHLLLITRRWHDKLTKRT